MQKTLGGVPVGFIAFFSVLALIFLAYPSIDLMITSLFYDHGFFLKDHPFVSFVYRFAPLIGIGMGVWALIVLVILWIGQKASYTCRLIPSVWRRKELAFVVLALALGPGLMVNGVFKEGFGRARPAQVVEFGGTKTFTPPFVITNQCETNCSFVCGHASAGFFFVSVALVVRREWQKRVFWSGVALGGLLGIVRIVQGGHFTSDVIFSFVAVYMTGKVLYFLMFERQP